LVILNFLRNLASKLFVIYNQKLLLQYVILFTRRAQTIGLVSGISGTVGNITKFVVLIF